MKSKKFLRPVNVTFASLVLAWMTSILAAQNPASVPLTVERIAEERERNKALPKDLKWGSDGKTLPFIRTALRPRRTVHGPSYVPMPASEIWGIDGVDGKEKLLV